MREAKGTTPTQIQCAYNWQTAHYSPAFRPELGLPPELTKDAQPPDPPTSDISSSQHPGGYFMAVPTRLDLTRPQTFASNEERLAVLRQAIDDGIAGGVVEGDIFEIIRAEFGFPPYEDE